MKRHTDSANDEFYVGYQASAPPSYARRVRSFILLIALAVPLLAFIITKNELGFPTSTFELGQLTTLEGVLTMEPFPMLKMDWGKDATGNPVYQSVLLIGFGKFGAEKTIEAIEKEQGISLEGKRVKLEGTLIYHDGKTLLELTKKEAALKEVREMATLKSTTITMGEVELTGEIADPKCFFGVMKPGEGKPHRSCAVRCISGGIPPVLKVTNQINEHQYFLLKGLDDQPVNKALLSYVGEGIKITGQLSQVDDWFVLKIDPDKITRTTIFLLGNAPMCTDKGELSAR